MHATQILRRYWAMRIYGHTLRYRWSVLGIIFGRASVFNGLASTWLGGQAGRHFFDNGFEDHDHSIHCSIDRYS